MTVLLANDLDSKAFRELMNLMEWPGETLVMAFAPHRFWFEPLQEKTGFLENTEQGRIFSTRGEFRWRLIDCDLFRILYLGEDIGNTQLQNCSHELRDLTPKERRLFLWGERTDLEREWIDQQIPHRFVYPLFSENFPRGRVCLVLEEWLDNIRQPVFSRYTRLEEEKEINHASG